MPELARHSGLSVKPKGLAVAAFMSDTPPAHFAASRNLSAASTLTCSLR